MLLVSAALLATFLCAASCRGKDEAQRALDDAKRLAEQGDYEGALAKHVWFHDNALRVRRSYYGVRLSFALSYWVELGKRYPKALEKLKGIRDQKTSRLMAGEANRDLFHDVESINQHLGETSRTVDLFKRIDASNPKFASEVYELAADALVEAREYALAKKHLGDPKRRLAVAKQNFDSGMSYARTSNGYGSREAFERIYTEAVVQIITVLRETNDEAAAKAIQSEALKTFDSPAIRNAIKQ